MKNKVTENKGSFEFLFKGTGEAPEKLELKSRDTSQRYMHLISYHSNGLCHKSELNFKGPQVKHDKDTFHLKAHSKNDSLQRRRNFGKRVLSTLYLFVLQQKARKKGRGVGCGVKGNLDSIFPRISDSERNVNEFADYALAAICGFDQFLGPNFGLCL